MNWRFVLVFSLIFSLMSARVAFASGDHESKKESTSTSQEMKDDHDMEGMDMSGDDSSDGQDMEGMDMENEGGGHGHGPVMETHPNVKVLGTYGAINLSFILIGIWSKWFRRKDGSHVSAK